MDGSRFDQIARSLTALRSRRTAVATLGAALGMPALAALDADAKKKRRKRKKKCAKKCPDGCCTGKYGSCILPAQQSTTVCGTGGEICRSTGCPTCDARTPCPSGECCTREGHCGACLAFMSSEAVYGNVGGLAGADAVCQRLAVAADLPGAYMAWISDPTGSPLSRFTKATVPYIRVDGTTIAQDWNDLTSGSLDHTLNMFEYGVTMLGNHPWTCTDSSGAMKTDGTPAHCQQWSVKSSLVQGSVGDATATDSAWTNDTSVSGGPCNGGQRLYCFQQQ